MARTKTELNDIYVQYVNPIRNYLYRLSGDRFLTEDLVQEVFYKAMRQLLTGARIEYISAWLYRIARNLYLDHVKKQALETMSLDQWKGDSGNEPEARQGLPEQESLRHEQHDAIVRAMQALPENQRTALLLRDMEGLSYEEIAEAMQLSLSAVKSCIYRARQSFAEAFTQEGGI